MDVYASKMMGQQWHVVQRFAKALEVIPRTLAENAAVGKRGTTLLIGDWEKMKSLNPLMAHIQALVFHPCQQWERPLIYT
jgi:hypothetical protein